MKNWYILKIKKGFEDIVKKDIEILFKKKNLINIIEHIIIIPSSIKNNVEKKNYSYGYLLIKIEYSSNIYNLIKKTNNTIKFITKNNQPLKIDKEEIKKLVNKLNINNNNSNNQKKNTNNYFFIGENIRIKNGPFLDYVGKITYIDYKKEKIHVKILVFGRTTSIDLNFNQIEKE